MVTSLGFNTKSKVRKKYKKARYVIRNVSEKDLLKIIKDFEKIEKLPYEKKRPKHEPTDCYFYLARQLVKCTMRSDTLNSHVYPIGREMTATKHILISHICSKNDSELK